MLLYLLQISFPENLFLSSTQNGQIPYLLFKPKSESFLDAVDKTNSLIVQIT